MVTTAGTGAEELEQESGGSRGAGDVTAKTNSWLSAAKASKQDEFYTQLSDIEKELRHFRKHFKGKVVLCNCDDPYESDFFKYFVINFRRLGIRKLIASCYAGSPVAGRQLSFSDLEGLSDEDADARRPYKIEITEIPDADGDGSIGLADVEYLLRHDANVLTALEGDGDFRSAECLALLEEADLVVTNPPFSLMIEYLTTLLKYEKRFLVLGNVNQAIYSGLFPHIQEGRLWLGANAGHFWFRVPDHYEPKSTDYRQDADGQKWRRMGGICWYTNLDHSKRHERMVLVEKYGPDRYPHYDNYDAIEVRRTVDIPEDWNGVMGVPVTFLAKYNPDQFEILGTDASNDPENFGRTRWYTSQECRDAYLARFGKPGTYDLNAAAVVGGVKRYKRVFIRRIGESS